MTDLPYQSTPPAEKAETIKIIPMPPLIEVAVKMLVGQLYRQHQGQQPQEPINRLAQASHILTSDASTITTQDRIQHPLLLADLPLNWTHPSASINFCANMPPGMTQLPADYLVHQPDARSLASLLLSIASTYTNITGRDNCIRGANSEDDEMTPQEKQMFAEQEETALTFLKKYIKSMSIQGWDPAPCIGAMINVISVIVPVRAGIMSLSDYQQSGLRNPLKDSADPREYTMMLVVPDDLVDQARQILHHEIHTASNYLMEGQTNYLSIGMGLGGANQNGSSRNTLLLHEGTQLAPTYGRTTMTTFKHRILKRFRNYDTSRAGTDIVS